MHSWTTFSFAAYPYELQYLPDEMSEPTGCIMQEESLWYDDACCNSQSIVPAVEQEIMIRVHHMH